MFIICRTKFHIRIISHCCKIQRKWNLFHGHHNIFFVLKEEILTTFVYLSALERAVTVIGRFSNTLQYCHL
jgi:hypothetical protein